MTVQVRVLTISLRGCDESGTHGTRNDNMVMSRVIRLFVCITYKHASQQMNGIGMNCMRNASIKCN